MARPPRFSLPGYPQHVTKRGNNRAPVFFTEDDRRFYLKCLRQACARYRCDVHAYVLMTNHVHLLMTPDDEDGLSRAMQFVGARYAQYVNWRRERTGSLWEGRYHASLVDSDRYFLVCSRYIELNPVRAGLVPTPGEYRWSSFHVNVAGRDDPIVRPHSLYLSLGTSPADRCSAYSALFAAEISADTLAEIREATHKGWPLGDRAFRERIERLTHRRASPLPKGGPRPRKINRL
jgi:putative transposase